MPQDFSSTALAHSERALATVRTRPVNSRSMPAQAAVRSPLSRVLFPKLSVQEEAINSVEWAVLAAALVLGARLLSLIQASRGVDQAHRKLRDTLSREGLEGAEREAQGLGYRNPFGEIAGELLNAAQREAHSDGQRSEFVQRARSTVRGQWTRRIAQGRALDLFALVVGGVVVAFAPQALPTGPLFWSCGGAMPILLLGTFVARGQLLANLLRAADGLTETLIARPMLPSLSGSPIPCLWCGEATREALVDVVEPALAQPRARAMLCAFCGKLVASVEALEDESPS